MASALRRAVVLETTDQFVRKTSGDTLYLVTDDYWEDESPAVSFNPFPVLYYYRRMMEGWN
jgi:hypothetical protein